MPREKGKFISVFNLLSRLFMPLTADLACLGIFLQLKCVGNVQAVCDRCRNLDINCVRPTQPATGSPTFYSPVASHQNSDITTPMLPNPVPQVNILESEQHSHFSPERNDETATESTLPLHTPIPPEITLLGQFPTGKELEELVRLYFSSVHRKLWDLSQSLRRKDCSIVLIRTPSIDFGYFAFIHQFHFNRLLSRGKAPHAHDDSQCHAVRRILLSTLGLDN